MLVSMNTLIITTIIMISPRTNDNKWFQRKHKDQISYKQLYITIKTRRSEMKADKLIGLLNKTLANLHLLYVKLHNYTCTVKGMNFKPIHELIESYYEYFAKSNCRFARFLFNSPISLSAFISDLLVFIVIY